jgi:hypothetical protein
MALHKVRLGQERMLQNGFDCINKQLGRSSAYDRVDLVGLEHDNRTSTDAVVANTIAAREAYINTRAALPIGDQTRLSWKESYQAFLQDQQRSKIAFLIKMPSAHL